MNILFKFKQFIPIFHFIPPEKLKPKVLRCFSGYMQCDHWEEMW